MLYGGSIMPGKFRGKDVTIQDVFEAVGACSAGRMTESDLRALEDVACPGAGACGGQFTANTMSMAGEMLGLSPMGLNDVPAVDPRKGGVAARARRDRHEAGRRRSAPEQDPDARRVRQRDHRGGRDRGLDERRAAPAGASRARRASR